MFRVYIQGEAGGLAAVGVLNDNDGAAIWVGESRGLKIIPAERCRFEPNSSGLDELAEHAERVVLDVLRVATAAVDGNDPSTILAAVDPHLEAIKSP